MQIKARMTQIKTPRIPSAKRDVEQLEFTYCLWEHKMKQSLWKTEHQFLKCLISVQLDTQSCPTLCDPMDCSTPGFPVHHQLPKPTQIHVHRIGDAIQPSHPLSTPSPPAFNLSQHQGLFQWVGSSHQVAEVLEFQLQDQSFQCLIYIYHIIQAFQVAQW